MKYRIIPVTHFQQNCILLWCENTGKAALVDPGGDVDRLMSALAREGVALERILITHGHLDHVGAARAIASAFDVPVEGPGKEDEFWLASLSRQSAMFGLPEAEALVPDRWLKDGDQISVGDLQLHAIHCPGHTPGHMVYFEPVSRTAFVGDVLFKGAVGRSDFPGGSHDALIASIREKLLPLGDDVAFIPGHGPMSTFGEERLNNPFLLMR